MRRTRIGDLGSFSTDDDDEQAEAMVRTEVKEAVEGTEEQRCRRRRRRSIATELQKKSDLLFLNDNAKSVKEEKRGGEN